MYLDTLDTVRFNEVYYENTTYSYSLAKASIASNLMQNKRIVLSQSQIFDSPIILTSLGDDGFRKLIESNYIIASLYGTNKNVSLTNHLLNYLNFKKDFIFSSVSNDDAKQSYYRNNIIAMLEGKAGSDVCRDEKLIAFKNMIEFFTYLERTRDYKYIISNQYSEKLSDFFVNPKLSSNSQINRYMKILNKIATKSKTLTNDRTSFYKRINSFEVDRQKARAIVDIAYNYIVGHSIMGKDSFYEITASGKIFNAKEWDAVKYVFGFDSQNQNKSNNYTEVEYYTNEEKFSIRWDEICDFLDFLKYNQNLGNRYKNFIQEYLLSFKNVAVAVSSGILGFVINKELVNTLKLSCTVEWVPITELISAILAGILDRCESDEAIKKLKTKIKIKKIQNMKGIAKK